MEKKRLKYSEDGKVPMMRIDAKVKIIVHAPLFFQSILESNDITLDSLMTSLNPKTNRDSVFRAGEGAGASGSFFFFSKDKRFIIKTMSSDELTLFLKLLPEYEQHMAIEKKSLFSRIYGVYTI
jgi:1-phosphatidylinositol-4-phosphate 5-kinase